MKLQYVPIVFIGLLCFNAHAAIINVPGVNGPTIQAAIVASSNGDEIIVATGTYLEAIDFLGKAITVRSTDPNDPVVVMQTIIDGTGSFHVVQCVNSEGPNSVLNGFVITGGNANGATPDDRGGGMYNLGSNPTVTNCWFSVNSAVIGGGMYNDNSSPAVADCMFSGNSAVTAGGMYNYDNSNPTVINCSISGNTATNNGGGMVNLDFSHPTVTNCSFSGNKADIAGGMGNSNGCSPSVTNCSFSGNTANNSGGGMFNIASSSPMVTNCSFSGNTANLFGGGMCNELFSFPTVTNCSFNGNTAANVGGGIYNTFGGNPTVTNTGFCFNTPDQIDGAYTDGGGNALQYCGPPIPAPNPCPADTTGPSGVPDGIVDVEDLLLLLGAWGACP